LAAIAEFLPDEKARAPTREKKLIRAMDATVEWAGTRHVAFKPFADRLSSPATNIRGEAMKIGVTGLGAMGANLAARLMEVGHEVHVWNRTAAKAKPSIEAGAKAAGSPAELAAKCEAVITILTDGTAIDDVYNGAQGLLSGNVAGKLFIEMSTVAPKVEADLAPKVRAKGAALVECPVGGSTAPARKGQLLGLMGAEPADAKRALPVLEQLCRKVEHCGPVGSGAAVKLAINLPLMVAWQAYGEAFAIARSVGWPPQRLLDLFVESNGANNGLKMRAAMIVKMFEHRNPGPTTFSIANAVKDLRTMVATGETLGADMRATKAALSAFEDAAQHGHGGDDGAQMTVYWAERKR
jgi:3-hydroxyisobutyrate dehydrogenase